MTPVAALRHRLSRDLTSSMALVIAAAALFAVGEPAKAQNLVSDPYFANGVPENGYTDSSGNTYYASGATAGTFDGVTGLFLSGSEYGYFEIAPLAAYNSNGVNYALTFLAAAVNPDTYSPVYAQFGSTTDNGSCGGGCAALTQSLNSTALTQLSLTGTSATGGGYLYVQGYGGGDVFVTDLNFEPAPAPLPGAGLLSLGALVAGLAFHRLRRPTAA
jgi:hypothetical protein